MELFPLSTRWRRPARLVAGSGPCDAPVTGPVEVTPGVAAERRSCSQQPCGDSFSLDLTAGAPGPGRDTLNCHVDCRIWYSGYTEMLVCRGRNKDLDLMRLMSKQLTVLKWELVAGFVLHVWFVEQPSVCPARPDGGNAAVRQV